MQVAEHILVKDKNNKIVAYLMPIDGVKDAFVDCRINGESTLEFLMPVESEKWKEITPECKFYVYDREYIILKDDAIDIVREGQKIYGKVMAVESWYKLDLDYPEPLIDNSDMWESELSVTIVSGGSDLSNGKYQIGTASHALYALLQGTGWDLETVDVTGIHDLETEKISTLENIKQVQKIWGGLLVWDSVNKKVSLRNEDTWKPYNGFQIRYAKNLKHITRTQSNRIITKLYPFGEDDLDIADVNNDKKYLTNYDYTTSVFVGTYINPDIHDQEELKEKATEELKKISKPRYNYKVNVVDLRTLPEFSHEDFAVGDMVDIIDKGVLADDRVRLLRHRFNIFQPWKCELEVGDPEKRFIEDLKETIDTTGYIDKIINSKGLISGEKLTDGSIRDAKIRSLTASKLTAGTIDADVITVENLEVGRNVVMGENATINWGQVDNIPNDIVYEAVLEAYPTHTELASTLASYTTDSKLATALAGYVTTGNLSDELASYLTTSNFNTLIGQDYIITGKISANKIASGEITGITIQTAASGNRIVLGNDKYETLNSGNKLHGVSMDAVGGTSSFRIHDNGNHKFSIFYGAIDETGAKVFITATDNSPMKISAGTSNMSITAKNIYMEGNVNFNNATISGLKVRLG